MAIGEGLPEGEPYQPHTFRAYKHVPAEFADAFASGEAIQIGTLESYRADEGLRGDPLEGLAVEYVTSWLGSWSQSKPLTPQEERALQVMGQRVGTPKSPYEHEMGMFNNIVVYGVPNLYIFCASLEPDFTLVEKGHRIFCISNLVDFARELSIDNIDFLGHPWVKPVDYVARVGDPFVDGPRDQGPFFKDPKFSWEKEVRVVWKPSRSGNPREILYCPEVRTLIHEIMPT